MPSANYQILYDAIREKKAMSAYYDGLPRLFCPHVLGYNDKDEEMCLVYQYGGETTAPRTIQADGSPANWRHFNVKELMQLQIIAGGWHTATSRKTFKRSQCIVQIDIEVPY